MKKIVLAIAITILISGWSGVDQTLHNNVSPLINIKDLAGKNEAELDKLLEKPEVGNIRLEDHIEQSITNYYTTNAGVTGATFIEGQMIRLSVELKDDFKFPEDAVKALKAIGLEPQSINIKQADSQDLLRFSDIDGFSSVLIYPDTPKQPDRIREIKVVVDGT
jgi:hypothetical protein